MSEGHQQAMANPSVMYLQAQMLAAGMRNGQEQGPAGQAADMAQTAQQQQMMQSMGFPVISGAPVGQYATGYPGVNPFQGFPMYPVGFSGAGGFSYLMPTQYEMPSVVAAQQQAQQQAQLQHAQQQQHQQQQQQAHQQQQQQQQRAGGAVAQRPGILRKPNDPQYWAGAPPAGSASNGRASPPPAKSHQSRKAQRKAKVQAQEDEYEQNVPLSGKSRGRSAGTGSRARASLAASLSSAAPAAAVGFHRKPVQSIYFGIEPCNDIQQSGVVPNHFRRPTDVKYRPKPKPGFSEMLLDKTLNKRLRFDNQLRQRSLMLQFRAAEQLERDLAADLDQIAKLLPPSDEGPIPVRLQGYLAACKAESVEASSQLEAARTRCATLLDDHAPAVRAMVGTHQTPVAAAVAAAARAVSADRQPGEQPEAGIKRKRTAD